MMERIQNNVAYVVKRLIEIRGERPGKKMLQKTVFLIEEKGVSLGYNFGIHFYGPYSEALEATTLYLGADGVLEFDYSGRSHLINANQDNFDI